MNRYPRLGILSPGLSPQLYYIILLYDCGHLTSLSLDVSICEMEIHRERGEISYYITLRVLVLPFSELRI